MKALAAALIACASFNAAAALNPRTVTCSELRDLVEGEGRVLVSKGLIGISRTFIYSNAYNRANRPCFDGKVTRAVRRTSDRLSCVAGIECQDFGDNDL